MKIVSKRNQGAAAARNRALAVSQGDYVQWLDADDLLAPDKIKAQMESAGARDPRCSSPRPGARSPTATESEVQAERAVAGLAGAGMGPAKDGARRLHADRHVAREPRIDGRSRTLGRPVAGDDDGEYFCRVVLASAGVKFVPESKVFYRTIIGGLGYVGTSSQKLEANLLSVESQIGYVRAVADDERVRAACLTFLERDLRWYHPHRLDLAERCDALASSLGRRLRPPSVPRKYA